MAFLVTHTRVDLPAIPTEGREFPAARERMRAAPYRDLE